MMIIHNNPRKEIFMNFGERLQELRKQKNLSQEQLADLPHVSRQTISRWETSQTTPDLSSLEKLCELYEMSYDELLLNKKSKKTFKFSYMSLIIFIIMFSISFFLPNSQDDFSTSMIVITPAGFALTIGIIGILLSCLQIYKDHRK